jgi:hypothetical protein
MNCHRWEVCLIIETSGTVPVPSEEMRPQAPDYCNSVLNYASCVSTAEHRDFK